MGAKKMFLLLSSFLNPSILACKGWQQSHHTAPFLVQSWLSSAGSASLLNPLHTLCGSSFAWLAGIVAATKHVVILASSSSGSLGSSHCYCSTVYLTVSPNGASKTAAS